MTPEKIEYSHGGKTFVGELYRDDSKPGPLPGVVLYPEAFGLNDHARVRAERLAKLGYVVLCADPHGDGAVYTDMKQLAPAMQALFGDRQLWRARARCALDTLAAQQGVDKSKLAAIGFCFGGATCLELARSGADLKAIVSFHGGLQPEDQGDEGNNQAKVLICHGAEDPLLQKEVIDAVMDEFRRDKVDWQFIYYGNAEHSFTDPDADKKGMPGLSYDARTEARSWTAMRNFFDEVFG